MAKTSKTYEFGYGDDYIFDKTKIEATGSLMQLRSPISTANPSIRTRYSIPLTAINTFIPSYSAATGSAIKYTLIKDGQDYYYSSGWVVSDGTYSQSNTLAEIQANLATFTTTRVRVKVRIFLHSDGVVVPTISTLDIGFDYEGYCTPDDVRGLLGRAGASKGINDEDIITAIETADSQINAYLSKYTLPLTTVPAQVRSYSVIIAAYNSYSSFEVAEGVTKSPHRVRYEQAMRELEKIHKGEKSITGLTANSNLTVYASNDDDGDVEYENSVELLFDRFDTDGE